MNFSFLRFIKTLQAFPNAVQFIRKHQVWVGFTQYSWVTILLLIVAGLFSLKFYSSAIDWWQHLRFTHIAEVGSEARNVVSDFLASGQSFFLSSSFKYVIFILMEIVIFHTVGRTIEIISGEQDRKPTFAVFMKAQVRMIQVSIQSWIKEIIATILIGIALSFVGFHEIKPVVVFLVSCYFIGFAMVDNYNERLGMSIKESLQFTRGYVGVALAIGLVVYVIMLVPVVGAFVGPLLGGVTATLVMHEILQPATNDDYEYFEEIE